MDMRELGCRGDTFYELRYDCLSPDRQHFGMSFLVTPDTPEWSLTHFREEAEKALSDHIRKLGLDPLAMVSPPMPYNLPEPDWLAAARAQPEAVLL